MKEQHDYIRDISEMRSMMERSAKFTSLSGWSGAMAGLFGLVGAYLAYASGFHPQAIADPEFSGADYWPRATKIAAIGLATLLMALASVVYFSRKRALRQNEQLRVSSSKRLVAAMAVPLVSGGLLALVLIFKGFSGLLVPITSVFYGISMYNAGRFTYPEIKTMGLIEIALGLSAACFVGYGLLLWSIGFGIVHIVYGVFLHFKYER